MCNLLSPILSLMRLLYLDIKTLKYKVFGSHHMFEFVYFFLIQSVKMSPLEVNFGANYKTSPLARSLYHLSFLIQQ